MPYLIYLFIYFHSKHCDRMKVEWEKKKKEIFHNISVYYKQKNRCSFLLLQKMSFVTCFLSFYVFLSSCFSWLTSLLSRVSWEDVHARSRQMKLPVLCNGLWGSHLHSPMKNKKENSRSMIEKSINRVEADNRQCNHTLPHSFLLCELKPFRQTSGVWFFSSLVKCFVIIKVVA